MSKRDEKAAAAAKEAFHAECQTIPVSSSAVHVDGELVRGPAEHLVHGTAVPHEDEAPVADAVNEEASNVSGT